MGKPSFYKDLTKRVQKMFPNDYDRIRERADDMLREMCAGEKNKPKAVTMHTVDRIFPCISIYKAIDEVNGQKEAAYEMISDYFEEISLKASESIQRICRFPLIYRLTPWMAGKIIKKQFGEKSGFKMKVHHAHGKKCHIDMLKCPYHQYCKFYDCEELTTAFCNADDVAYSNMHPNVSWDRTKTLGNIRMMWHTVICIRMFPGTGPRPLEEAISTAILLFRSTDKRRKTNIFVGLSYEVYKNAGMRQ